MITPCWDVLGIGIVAVDDLLTVESYPPSNTKTPVLEKSRQGEGLTGTALVAASRVGARCGYGGVLGEDDLSNWTEKELEREGVDCSPVIRQADARPYHSIIVVDRTNHTRTIFYSGAGVAVRPVEEIKASLISRARVFFMDHQGVGGMLRAACIAKELGIPTVADIESDEHPQTDELIERIEHLILSGDFAYQLTGKRDPVQAIESLPGYRACTAITAGKEGCWYISDEQPGRVQHQPAFKVEVVDTTGCGDVFHGAYAAGIAWGWSVSKCICFASAVAALKATKLGGRAGIPDRDTVFQFLRAKGHRSFNSS